MTLQPKASEPGFCESFGAGSNLGAKLTVQAKTNNCLAKNKMITKCLNSNFVYTCEIKKRIKMATFFGFSIDLI